MCSLYPKRSLRKAVKRTRKQGSFELQKGGGVFKTASPPFLLWNGNVVSKREPICVEEELIGCLLEDENQKPLNLASTEPSRLSDMLSVNHAPNIPSPAYNTKLPSCSEGIFGALSFKFKLHTHTHTHTHTYTPQITSKQECSETSDKSSLRKKMAS
jgi:hypothetical protein